jgi:hypothetical protein
MIMQRKTITTRDMDGTITTSWFDLEAATQIHMSPRHPMHLSDERVTLYLTAGGKWVRHYEYLGGGELEWPRNTRYEYLEDHLAIVWMQAASVAPNVIDAAIDAAFRRAGINRKEVAS